MSPTLDETVRALAARERRVWLAALVAYGGGDLATTLVGLATERAAEGGPIASVLVARYGLVGIVALKLVSVGAFYLLWRVAPRPARVAVPLALAVVGTAVTAWNLVALA